MKIVPKVWGEEHWIVNKDYCGKLLILKKGYRCSLHHHKNKDETFYIVKGKVLMETDGEEQIMESGDSAHIKPNRNHRFTGLEHSEIIEFSTHHEEEDSYRDTKSGRIDVESIELKTEKNVLVTGGAGFIGSTLAIELQKLGFNVIIADNLSSGNKDNLADFTGKFIDADVSLPLPIAGKLDIIFHLASITDTTFKDDTEMIQQNLNGMLEMIRLAKKTGARLVYASSAGIYGNGHAPMNEHQNPEPLNAYALSKSMMDTVAEKFSNDIKIIGLRYFNVFGPKERLKGKSSSMIYQLAKKMLKGEKPGLFTDGNQKRDHIYVKDVVKATIAASKAEKFGIYNVGTGIATTFNEVVAALNESLGTNLEIEYFDNPIELVYQNNTQADTANIQKDLNWKAEYSFKDAVKEYVEIIKRESD